MLPNACHSLTRGLFNRNVISVGLDLANLFLALFDGMLHSQTMTFAGREYGRRSIMEDLFVRKES